MNQERLSGLVILSIERQLAQNVDFDDVIQVFADKRNRRMELKGEVQ